MNMRKWLGLMLVLMLVFVLAACGGDKDDDSGDTGSDGDSTSASNSDLPQTITSEDASGGSLTVSYPEGWVALDNAGSVTLAESQETLDLAMGASGTAPTFDDNAVFATVSALGGDIVGFLMPEGVEVTPATVLENTLLNGEGFDAEPVEIVDLNGKSGATAAAVSTNPDEPGRIFAAVVQVGDGYVIVAAFTNPDETDFDDEIRAIAGSIEATCASLEIPADATEEPAG